MCIKDIISIKENDFEKELIAYPNPTNGNIAVELDRKYESVKTNILNMNGKIIDTKVFAKSNQLFFEIDEPAGYYFMEIITTENKKAVIKFLKE